MSRKKTKLQLFEELYEVEIKNSAWITKDDMTEKGFFPKTGSNGKDIRFIKTKYELEEYKEGVRTPKFKVLGLVKDKYSRHIKADIVKKLKNKPCAFLNTYADIEIDHKNGRYNNPRVMNVKTQTIDDFQPLSKIMNNKKREECSKCIETGVKFDARTLGFTIPNLNGVFTHDGTSDGCRGCFLYDIDHFKKVNKFILNELLNKNNLKNKDFFDFYNDCVYKKGS